MECIRGHAGWMRREWKVRMSHRDIRMTKTKEKQLLNEEKMQVEEQREMSDSNTHPQP